MKAAGSISYQHNGNQIETVKYDVTTRGLTLKEVTGFCDSKKF